MADKIGLDFHGVISAEPEKFKIFCHEIRKKGIKVYVISGGPRNDVEKYLQEQGIEYDVVWAILDLCEAKGTARFYDDGSFFVPTEIWNKAKAEYCIKEDIKFHVDDSPLYGRYFVTPYCEYDIDNGCCCLSNQLKINFAEPKEAADIIARFLNDLELIHQLKDEGDDVSCHNRAPK